MLNSRLESTRDTARAESNPIKVPAEAVEAAIYLHGLAADFAVRWQDQHTLLAMDTVSHLYEAFRFRAEDQGGYVWLQGMPGMLRERE